MSKQNHPFLWIGVLLVTLSGCSTPPLQPNEGYVSVPGGRVKFKVVGSGPGTPLLLLHGGPGFPSDYLERLSALGDDRPVIFYDQLGCGRSDRPKDTNLWLMARFVEELRCVRRELGLRRVHILGHSWGTMLATDYMLTRPAGVKSLILAGPCLSIPRYLQDVAELRKQLPPEIQETLMRHEAAGTTGSAEYQRAGMAFLQKHICRLDPWPREMEQSLAGMGSEVYNTMWGPSEFYATGPLKSYDRTSRLGELRLPVLITAGRFDECTPSASAWYQSQVPGSRLAIFENSSHMTMLEESEAYIWVLRKFLRDVEHRDSLHR